MREWLVSGWGLRMSGKTLGLLTGTSLLLALLLTVAGCATKVAPEGAEGATKTSEGATEAAKVFPWKTGDVIKAEYVDYMFGQGVSEYTLITQEGFWISFTFDQIESCDESSEFYESKPISALCAQEAIHMVSVDDVMSFTNFGRQILITFKELLKSKKFTDGTFSYYIEASRVQLDHAPNAPRNTHVLPNQKITGTIWCPDYKDIADDGIYLITNEGAWHELVAGSPRWGISGLCEIEGPVTLQGEFLLWAEDRLFRTWQ